MAEPQDWQLDEGDVNLGEARAAYRRTSVGSTSSRWIDEDAEHFLHQSLSTPCLDTVVAAQGAYLITAEGRRILDFHGNNVHQVGFAHPQVVTAVKAQMDVLSFSTRRYTNPAAVELARRLTELAPDPLRRVLFAPAATLAMSTALKLARLATGRYKTLSLWGSFHGASMDALSVGGEQTFRRGLGPLLPGAIHVPPANPRQCPFDCGEACTSACVSLIEHTLAAEGDIGAVVLETIRNTDVLMPPQDYLQKVARACRIHGALLILDETAIAFGRTGKLFAFEHYGVVPDMVVLGKGLGASVMPLAALLVREDLNIAQATSIGHYTHEKSPLGAVAAMAMLDVLKEYRLCERSAAIGEVMGQRLREMAIRHPVVRSVRGIGALWGVELDVKRDASLAERVMYESLARGLNFKVSSKSVLTLSPPLIITDEQLAEALETLDASLVAATGATRQKTAREGR